MKRKSKKLALSSASDSDTVDSNEEIQDNEYYHQENENDSTEDEDYVPDKSTKLNQKKHNVETSTPSTTTTTASISTKRKSSVSKQTSSTTTPATNSKTGSRSTSTTKGKTDKSIRSNTPTIEENVQLGIRKFLSTPSIEINNENNTVLNHAEPIIHRPKVIYQDTDLTDIPLEFWEPIHTEQTETMHSELEELVPVSSSPSNTITSSPPTTDIQLPLWIYATQRSIKNIHWNIPKPFSSSQTNFTTSFSTTTTLVSHNSNSTNSPTASWPTSFDLLQEASSNHTFETAYLIHLRFMIRTVYESSLTKHLWTPQENQWIKNFLSLSPAAAGLFARMFQRKGPWFRTSSFQWYPELFAATSKQPALNDPSLSTPAASTITSTTQPTDELDEEEEVVTDTDIQPYEEELIAESNNNSSSNSNTDSASVTNIVRSNTSSTTISNDIMDDTEKEAGVIKPLTHDIHGHPSFNTGNRGRYTGIPKVLLGNTSNLRKIANIKPLGFKDQRASSSFGRPSVPFNRILEAVDELKTAELIITLPFDKSLSSVVSRYSATQSSTLPYYLELYLEAIAHTLTVTEIKALMQRLGININGKGALTVVNNALNSIKIQNNNTNTNTSTNSSSSSSINSNSSTVDQTNILTNRLGLLTWLAYCVRTQRTVMGGYLPIEKALQHVLSSSAKGGNNPFNTPADSTTPMYFVVRSLPAFQALLRRIHGLFYLVTGSSHLSTGSGTGTWPIGQEDENDYDEYDYDGSNKNQGKPSTTSSSTSRNSPLDSSIIIVNDSDEEMEDHKQKVSRDPNKYLSDDPTTTLTPSFQSIYQNINPDLAALGSFGKQFQIQNSMNNKFMFGSGSKYADITSATETYIPTMPLAFMGNANYSSADNQNNSILGGLFSPGLLQIFRKLDFPPYQPNQSKPLFTSRLDLRMFELAHVFRAQADITGVFGIAMNQNNNIYEANNIALASESRLANNRKKTDSGNLRSKSTTPMDDEDSDENIESTVENDDGNLDEIEITEDTKGTKGKSTISVFRKQEQLSSGVSETSGLDWAGCFRLVQFPWDAQSLSPVPPIPTLVNTPNIPPVPPGTPTMIPLNDPLKQCKPLQASSKIASKSSITVSNDLSVSGSSTYTTGKLNQTYFSTSDMISPPHLAGVALLPYALQLLGISPKHPSCQLLFQDIQSYVDEYGSKENSSGIPSHRPLIHQTIERIIHLVHCIPKHTIPLGPMVPQDAVGARSLYGILLECTKTPNMMNRILSAIPLHLTYPNEEIAENIYTAPVPLLTLYRASLCLAMQAHMVNSTTGLSDYTSYTSNMEHNDETTPLSAHPWLHQLCPGSLYATLVWEGIDPLERSRMYVHTIPYLVQLTSQGAVVQSNSSNALTNIAQTTQPVKSLLTYHTGSGRFTPHRSGRWWARLCLNISHMGLHADAVACAEAGLFCPDVRAGDRLVVHDRAYRLRKKLQKTFTAVQKLYGISNVRVHRAVIPGRTMTSQTSKSTGQDRAERLEKRTTNVTTTKKRKSSELLSKTESPLIPTPTNRSANITPLPFITNLVKEEVVVDLIDSNNNTMVEASMEVDSSSPSIETVNGTNINTIAFSSSELSQIIQEKVPLLPYPKIVSLRLAGPANDIETSSSPTNNNGSMNTTPITSLPLGTPSDSSIIKNIELGGDDQNLDGILAVLQAQIHLDNVYAPSLGLITHHENESIAQDIAQTKQNVEEIKFHDPDMPSYDFIRKLARQIHPTFRPKPIGKDMFVRTALNRMIGEKSRFVAMMDEENDGEYKTNENIDGDTATSSAQLKKSPSKSSWKRYNITDQICQVFGVRFPGGPQDYRYVPIDWLQQYMQQTMEKNTNDQPLSETMMPRIKSEIVDGLTNTSSLTVTIEDLCLMYYWLEGGDSQVQEFYSKASLLPYDAGNTVNKANTGKTVSSAASGSGWRGIHCEGGPIRALFSLLMWDTLFGEFSQSIEGVFLTPYQDAPLDLDSPGVFYHNRLSIIRERLLFIASLNSTELAKEIGRIWRNHYGQTCRGLRWDRYPLQLLQLIAIGFGSISLACICDAIAMDHKHLAGGMPDLLLWRITYLGKEPLDKEIFDSSSIITIDPHGPDITTILPANARVEVALIEVKSPRDILSEKQQIWLRIYSMAGINIGICKIIEQQSLTAKRRSITPKETEPSTSTTTTTSKKSSTKKSRISTPKAGTPKTTMTTSTSNTNTNANTSSKHPRESPTESIIIDLMDDNDE